ncbi:hypothetical protein XF35_00925 [Streptomyces platensis subsp. clarensis]|nr:hypothetical protein [Streptomyces platensis subsp. clarensis]
MLDPDLLSIMACPFDHAALNYTAHSQQLTCDQCARIFEVRDQIPVLIPEMARQSREAVRLDRPHKDHA